MGLWQLGHAIQGVRLARHPAHGRGEDRRRRGREPLHRARPQRRAAHPVGPGRRLRIPAQVRRGPRRRSRDGQQQHLPGRRLQARQPHPRRPEGARQGGAAQPRLHRGDGQDRFTRPEGLAGRRDQLPRPGRHARPAGLARRGLGRDLRPARRRPAAGARVQVLRAGVLPHRRAGLGHVVRPLRRAGGQGDGVPGHRSPRTRHQHRVHRRPAAPAREARAPSTSTAVSTPTTTSSSAAPIPSSSSGSWSRWSAVAATARAARSL